MKISWPCQSFFHMKIVFMKVNKGVESKYKNKVKYYVLPCEPLNKIVIVCI